MEDFEYLGSIIIQDCSLDLEIDRRINKAAHAFHSLYRVVWCRKCLKEETELCLFKAVVLPTLLYGSEIWVSLAIHMKCLQAFIMGCLRVILGVMRWDKERNTTLWSLGGMERVEVTVMRRRLRWFGHVERMDDFQLPKCCVMCRPVNGRRSLSGQKRRWCNVLMSDMKWCDLWDNWRKIVQDKGAWKCMVMEAAANLNENKEAHKKEKKDEKKRRALNQQHGTRSAKSQDGIL